MVPTVPYIDAFGRPSDMRIFIVHFTTSCKENEHVRCGRKPIEEIRDKHGGVQCCRRGRTAMKNKLLAAPPNLHELGRFLHY